MKKSKNEYFKEPKTNLFILIVVLAFGIFAVWQILDFTKQADDIQTSLETGNISGLKPNQVVESNQVIKSDQYKVSFVVPDGWKAVEDDFQITLVPNDDKYMVRNHPGTEKTFVSVNDRYYEPYITVEVKDAASSKQRSAPIYELREQNIRLGDKIPADRYEASVTNSYITVGFYNGREYIVTLSAGNGNDLKSYTQILESIENSLMVLE